MGPRIAVLLRCDADDLADYRSPRPEDCLVRIDAHRDVDALVVVQLSLKVRDLRVPRTEAEGLEIVLVDEAGIGQAVEFRHELRYGGEPEAHGFITSEPRIECGLVGDRID